LKKELFVYRTIKKSFKIERDEEILGILFLEELRVEVESEVFQNIMEIVSMLHKHLPNFSMEQIEEIVKNIQKLMHNLRVFFSENGSLEPCIGNGFFCFWFIVVEFFWVLNDDVQPNILFNFFQHVSELESGNELHRLFVCKGIEKADNSLTDSCLLALLMNVHIGIRTVKKHYFSISEFFLSWLGCLGLKSRVDDEERSYF